jgi:hypothetical protein
MRKASKHGMKMRPFSESYAPRTVRFLGLWESRGWRLKAYGIAYDGEVPSTELVRKAESLALRDLPSPAVTEDWYGVGFLGVHQGRGSNLVFLDWWAWENELHHLVYVTDHTRPLDLQRVARGGFHGCVWDLAVVAFERRAWIATALLNPSSPDLEAYLATRFQGSV